jgi:murein DD-endopeptidase MepM/ murein hydrolase activator NlpD
MDALLPFISLLLLLPIAAGPILFKRHFLASLLIPALAIAIYAAGFLLDGNHPAIPVQGATSGDWNHRTFWYEPWGASGVHKGIDIFADKGRPVIASQGGIVLYSGKVGLGGQVLLVISAGWKLHYFAHLEQRFVASGALVQKGEEIGLVGDSGNAMGKPPHLHYSLVRLFPDFTRFDTTTQGWKKIWFLDPGKILTGQ